MPLSLVSAPAPVKAQAAEPVRSNHATQVRVTGPSGVRVNTWTGNLFLTLPLLNIPGRILPIQLSLSYNSSWRNNPSQYGFGWQLSYNIFYQVDAHGNITIVWEDGRSDTYIRDGGTFISPADVADVLTEYDAYSYLLKKKDGTEYNFKMPDWGRISEIREPNGNTLRFTYTHIDPVSPPPDYVPGPPALTAIAHSDGRRVQLSYSVDGNLTRITDLNSSPNRSIQFGYDADHNLISMIDLAGGVTRFAYDAEHFMTSITPPVGSPTTIAYTNAAVTQVSGELTTKSFAYDASNHSTTMTDTAPEGNQVTRFNYDTLGRIASIQDPLNHTTSMLWDANNNLTSFTDALQRTTTYTYDPSGNLLSVTDPLSHTTSYIYEPVHNRLTSVTDALGHTTTYTYDSLGNLLSEKGPLDHTTSYTYNDDNDVETRTDANGQVTSYQYNLYGDLTNITYPVGNATFTYDGAGNPTGMTNANASMSYAYDALNRVKNTNVNPFGKSTTYTYDAFGNRKTMTDPDGGVTNYTYDSANRLTGLTNPLSQTTSFVYDSRGRLTRKNLANGTYTLYTYDRANRLLTLVNKKSNGTVLSSYTYEYDAVGNRTKMTEADGGITTYTYDAINQLTKVVYPDATFQEFTYDAAGNRLSMTDGSGTVNYAYDNANRLLSAGTATYGWDDNGNQISKNEAGDITTYGYDFENRLVSVDLPGGATNTFTYYADGRRLSKTESGGQVTRYFYDGSNTILETNHVGTTTARYTSGLGIDDWLSMDRGGTSYFYEKDALGSVTGLTVSGGSEVATYEYEAFGKIRNQIGSVVNPYQFTGREYDAETGLHYYRTRYYESTIGRFLSKDLIRYFGGENLYRYVHNNPVLFGDPFGLRLMIIIQGEPCTPFINVRDCPGCFINIKNPHPFTDDPGTPRAIQDGSRRDLTALPDNKHIRNGGDNTGNYANGGNGPNGNDSGDGGGSGPESRPLDTVPSYFLGRQQPKPKPQQVTEHSVTLDDILPKIGPLNTTRNPYIPPIVLAFNDVNTSLAVDFIQRGTDQIKGAVLGVDTQNSTFEHDYSVCRRFQGYTMDTVVPISIPTPSGGHAWFWHSRSYNSKFIEETFTFTVFVKESTKTFTVDSRWTYEDYQQSLPAHDYIFNIRLWSPNVLEAYKLVRQTLVNLNNFVDDNGANWTLAFENDTESQLPLAFIVSGKQVEDEIRLTMRNWSSTPTTVTFRGGWRSYLDRETTNEFTQSVSVSPGLSTVVLTFPYLLDAVVYADHASFKDKVYVGSGFWFVFNDENNPWLPSEVKIIHGQCTTPAGMGSKALVIPNCAGMTGRINDQRGYVGLGVTINPNGLPADVSKYAAITFRARGDGRAYRLKIETTGVTNGNFHEVVITPPTGTWRQFVVPFSEFHQRTGDTILPFTGTDVKSVVWVAEGLIPHATVNLEIDQVAFFDSTVIQNTTSITSTNNIYSPYPITAHITDDKAITTGTLRYSVDDGKTYTSLAMSPVGGNVYKAPIPFQLLDTAVLYYIETVDNDGNVAVSPPSAPSVTHHLLVGKYSSILVDDFPDLGLPNTLGGDSGVSTQGGTGVISFENREMCFDYNVTASTSWAVYYTLLKGLDITAYNSVSFDIRGSQGGEIAKFGISDGQGHEPKLEISEYLPNGITTQMQRVTIPIAAFTNAIIDTSHMHSVSLAFENSIGSGQGKVCVDNIRFESATTPLRLNNFNDQDLQDGVGLGNGSVVNGGGAIDPYFDTSNPYSGVGSSLRLDYDVPSGYAIWQSGMKNDLSNFDRITFAVRGKNGGEKFNVYLDDGVTHNAWVSITDYTTVTTNWIEVDIPLQDFVDKGVNLYDIRFFKIAFEWESMKGTIFLDDIRFRPAVKITGNAGMSGVTLQYFDGEPRTVGTDGSGKYSFTVPYGWTGKVKPYKTDYVFSPSNYPYVNLDVNQNAQNYLAFQKLTEPQLISPPDDSQVLLLRPTFDWSDVPNAGSYTIQVSEDIGFAQIVLSSTPEFSTVLPQEDLPAGATLHWRVRAEGAGGPSKWSQVRSFTTPNPPGIPALISPSSDALVMSYRPLFKWNPVSLPRGTQFHHYQIQISTRSDFSTTEINVDLADVSTRMYEPSANLAANTPYYWRLRAYNSMNEVSSWSEVRYFHTPPLIDDQHPKAYSLDPSLSAPAIVAPLHGSVLANRLAVLDWMDVPGASNYILQVSMDPDFTGTILASVTTVDSRYVILKEIPAGKTLYWRVLVISGNKMSDWSAISSFDIP